MQRPHAKVQMTEPRVETETCTRLLSLRTVQSCSSSTSFECCSAQLSVTAAVRGCQRLQQCFSALQCKHFCTRGQLWLGPWPNLGSATPWQNMELLLFKISKIVSTVNTISIALQLEYCRISVSREPAFQNFPSHHFPRTMTCAEYK